MKARYGQRFEGVHQRHHAARPRNFLALEPMRITVAIPALMVGEGKCAGEGKQRVVMLANDLRADFRMLFHLVPLRSRQATALVQDVRRHTELADVVQRRSLHHQIGENGLGAAGLRYQPRVVAEPHHAVAHRGAFMVLHGPCQPANQLHAGGFKFRGSFLHQRFLLAPPESQFEVVAYARAQHFGVERLDDVIRRAELKAFHHISGLVLGGEENDRNVGGGGSDFEGAAYIVAAGAGHFYIEQYQIGRGLFKGAFQGRTTVESGADGVGVLQYRCDQIPDIFGVVHDQNRGLYWSVIRHGLLWVLQNAMKNL